MADFDWISPGRKKMAAPEDVEYFNIQLQMNYDLYDEYKQVERIIGNVIFLWSMLGSQ